MPEAKRDRLEKQREALRQEISTLSHAIIDMAAVGRAGRTNMDQLQSLKTARAIRQRELKDVEARLAQKG